MAVLIATLPTAATPEPSGDRVIVVLDDVADPGSVAAAHARDHGVALRFVYRSSLEGYAAVVPPDRLGALRRDPRVRFVAADREVAALTPLGFVSSSQVLPTGVDRINAERKANTGAPVHVAVLDTGIDLDHPDLQPNIAGGVNCSSGNSFDDGNGHGTHVAGTIAAVHNTVGVVGVAPRAKLWAVRVLNNGGIGNTSSIICGIDFVDANSPARGGPIAVANMSLGGGGRDDGNCGRSNNDPMHLAICTATDNGVTFVVAAGNDGADIRFFTPAAYDEVATVTALVDSDGKPCGLGPAKSSGADDTFASFSNFATLEADLGHVIGAPGVSILSTTTGGGTGTLSGTSMATPHVAGAAALYLAAHPGAAPREVLGALRASGEPPDVPFSGECALGSSHTDPSGDHPEPVVRADEL